MNSIITSQELKSIQSMEGVVLLDARTGKQAQENYWAKHIAGARPIDLGKHMAHIVENAAFGGRHPLPSLENFRSILQDLGVYKEARIVVYDTSNGANAAARCWWMLRAFGIESVQVLSGGLQAAEKEGIPMKSGEEVFEKTVVSAPSKWQWPISSIEEVEKELELKSATVIDVRDAYRYRGESEPIDNIAGHIPGAINIPFSENIDDNGEFLAPELLREKYQRILENYPEKRIIHCGSGVTACHTILALEYAGFSLPSLYVGSWSEWSRREGKEIAKEE